MTNLLRGYDGQNGRDSRVVRSSSGDYVSAHIRRLIFTGVLGHGDRIRQDVIASELGVSRIPVREAIIALDREGWVANERHRGAFVHGLDENSVHDHYELMGHIYALVSRRAIERSDQDAVARLVNILKTVKAADEPTIFAARTHAFWRQLIGMAGSRRLTSVIRVMPNLVPDNFFTVVPSAIAVQKTGLTALIKAIEASEGDAAAQHCITLFERQADNVVRLLADQNLMLQPSDRSSFVDEH